MIVRLPPFTVKFLRTRKAYYVEPRMEPAWIARVELPSNLTFAFTGNITAESANALTEELIIRQLMQRPHCCVSPGSVHAKLLLLPLRFTAALRATRFRRPGGYARTRSILFQTVRLVEAAVQSRRVAGLLDALPLVVVSSNSAAFDAAGVDFPWAHNFAGTPPPPTILLRLAPEYRYRSAPMDAVIRRPSARSRGAAPQPPEPMRLSERPYGFVPERLSPPDSTGKRRGPWTWTLSPLDAQQIRTHFGHTNGRRRQLVLAGSGVPLPPASPLLLGFVVVPYGTTHDCQGTPTTSVAEASASSSRGLLAHPSQRPMLVTLVGCVSLHSGPATRYRSSRRSEFWQARASLAAEMRRRQAQVAYKGQNRIQLIDTCPWTPALTLSSMGGSARGKTSKSDHSLRGFSLRRAFALYQTSRFCLAPPGDAISTSRIFDVLSHGCIPVATCPSLILPFASSLPWDDCVIWHPVVSQEDAAALLDRLERVPSADLQARQQVCGQLRDRAAVWDRPGAHCAQSVVAVGGHAGRGAGAVAMSHTVTSELLRRLRDPAMIGADWGSSIRSLAEGHRTESGVYKHTLHRPLAQNGAGAGERFSQRDRMRIAVRLR